VKDVKYFKDIWLIIIISRLANISGYIRILNISMLVNISRISRIAYSESNDSKYIKDQKGLQIYIFLMPFTYCLPNFII
jgi:hypothetical protein